jgi:6-phosphogluconolactonase/glucosamine-6-phosphate isomerase/deaminase
MKPTNFWSAMADTGENPKGAYREVLPGVRVYASPEEVARAAARSFVDFAWQSIAKHGEFMVALSGGNTPRMLFEFLASDEFRGQVDWAKVHVFWSDERAVPPESLESNYGMARRALLLRVPIPLATSDAPRTTTKKSCENICNSMIAVSRTSI